MNYHPSEKMLADYAQGSIEASDGLVVAAHLEVCPQCRAVVEQKEEACSGELLQTEPVTDESFDSMLAGIMDLPVEKAIVAEQNDATIEVNGKQFVLPRALRRLSGQVKQWHNYGGKVFSAQLDVDEAARISLLYISKGVTVPQHTHKGCELTLVLHGSFSDESGSYAEGDFIIADSSVKHAPSTTAEQDCLCLAVLTEPMIFTQGVARIFNMFGRGMYP